MMHTIWNINVKDKEKNVQYGKLHQIIQPTKYLIVDWIAACVNSLHEKTRLGAEIISGYWYINSK